ncbi:MAG: molybdopterin-dependent oxidoreductase [Alphaproteobacteria bacterium]|nr:molybdopterin-dependent oxidoreductase [Alphaproteobacteria bacterium]
MSQVTIYINSKPIEVSTLADNVLHASILAGNPLSESCYHNGLKAVHCTGFCAVYCRAEKSVMAACKLKVSAGMYIDTEHKKVRETCQRLLTFLLRNHPLECPVCPKNGECFLQDAVMHYGVCNEQVMQFSHIKKEQKFGQFLTTSMNRCISCGLCISFAQDVVGSNMIGVGYMEKGLELLGFGNANSPSILSGNLSDVCPVGAIAERMTLRGIGAKRIQTFEGLDLHDGCATPLSIGVADDRIIFVKPLKKEGRYRWISDKARFGFDGFSANRLTQSTVSANNKKIVSSLHKITHYLCDILDRAGSDRSCLLLGPFVDLETLFVLKKFSKKFGIKYISSHSKKIPMAFSKYSSAYTFGGKLSRLYEADAIVIVGLRPIQEAPLLHTMLVDHYRKNGTPILAMSHPFFMPYGKNVGPQSAHLGAMLSGASPYMDMLLKAQKPLFICGYDALSSHYADALYQAVRIVAMTHSKDPSWNPIAFIPPNTTFVGQYDMQLCDQGSDGLTGYGIQKSLQTGYLKMAFLFGFDHVPSGIDQKCFVVYQGTHKTAASNVARVTIPAYSHVEKNGLYVNAEGQLLRAQKSVEPLEGMCDTIGFLQGMMRNVDAQYYAQDRLEIGEMCYRYYAEHYGESGEKRVQDKSTLTPVEVVPETWGTSLKHYYATDSLSMASQNLQKNAKKMLWHNEEEGVW